MTKLYIMICSNTPAVSVRFLSLTFCSLSLISASSERSTQKSIVRPLCQAHIVHVSQRVYISVYNLYNCMSHICVKAFSQCEYFVAPLLLQTSRIESAF